MTRPDRDAGRGQLHRRSARAWRDEENPTGPAAAKDEAAPEGEPAPDETAADRDAALAAHKPHPEEPVISGPGSGGATDSAPGDREHEGMHGGPSRNP